MNAHQRRVARRKPRYIIDIEAHPPFGSWESGGFVDNDWKFPALHTGCFHGFRRGEMAAVSGRVFSTLHLSDIDFSALEERILAMTAEARSDGYKINTARLDELFKEL